MKLQVFLSMVFFSFWSLMVQAQAPTWIRLFPDPNNASFGDAAPGCASNDGGYVSIGNDGAAFIAKLNMQGNQEWKHTFIPSVLNTGSRWYHYKLISTADGGYLGLIGERSASWTYVATHLVKFDAFGQVTWVYTSNTILLTTAGNVNPNVMQTADGNYVFYGNDIQNNTYGAYKLNASGTALVWSNATPVMGTYIKDGVELNNGNLAFLYTKFYQPTDSLYLWTLNNQGQAQSTQNLGGFSNVHYNTACLATNSNSDLLVTASNRGIDSTYQFLLNSQGQSQWSHRVSGYTNDLVNSSLNRFIGTGSKSDANRNRFLWMYDLAASNGSVTWERMHTDPYNGFVWNGGMGLVENPATFGFYVSSRDSFDVVFQTDTMGRIATGRVSGQMYLDLNGNCTYEAGIDSVLANQVVGLRTSATSASLYLSTDAQGYYSFDLPLGSYQVFLPFFAQNPYAQACSNQGSFSISAINTSQTVDLGFQAMYNCPVLHTDIEMSGLRRCFDNTIYLSYSNYGVLAAQNAYVDVTLDPNLHLLGAFDGQNQAFPYASLGNHVYRFQLGTINALSQGFMYLRVNDSCNLALGQVACNTAHIYPDSSCFGSWNGPIIQTTGTCLNDSMLQFRVQNVGTGMNQPLDFLVIEDNVMLMRDSFTLGAGGSRVASFLTQQNKSYRIEAQQVSGFPAYLGDSIAWTNLGACQDSGMVLNSSILAYQNNHSPHFLDQDCEPARGSWDPNDKTASQEGYGTNHDIAPGTPLDYRIRFQNTGTDTAFRVVILDTLTAELNPETIELGLASHPYQFELLAGNIIRFTFFPIELPDSNTNVQASQGFVHFKIRPYADLPLGSRIENQAAIYFDYNEPVFTNTTFHTLNERFTLVTNVENVAIENVDLRTYPNPFREQTTFELQGQNFEQLELRLFDLTGRQVRMEQGSGNRIVLRGQGLEAGVYFFQLSSQGQAIASGKVIVQP